jgi:hypothetical protein
MAVAQNATFTSKTFFILLLFTAKNSQRRIANTARHFEKVLDGYATRAYKAKTNTALGIPKAVSSFSGG